MLAAYQNFSRFSLLSLKIGQNRVLVSLEFYFVFHDFCLLIPTARTERERFNRIEVEGEPH
jgi:hypothetical protein